MIGFVTPHVLCIDLGVSAACPTLFIPDTHELMPDVYVAKQYRCEGVGTIYMQRETSRTRGEVFGRLTSGPKGWNTGKQSMAGAAAASHVTSAWASA